MARRVKFRFTETPNQVLNCSHPVPTRGAVARRHERGMGCGGRDSVGAHGVAGRDEPRERWPGAQDERRCSVRQKRVVLTPQWLASSLAEVLRAQPGGQNLDPRGDGVKKARSPGRARYKPQSPLRRGCRLPPLSPYARARIHSPIAHETAGAACTRHPLRPLFEGELLASLGRIAPREREACP